MEGVLDRYSLYKPCTFPRCPNDIKFTYERSRQLQFCSNDCRDGFANRGRQAVTDIGKLSERVPRGASSRASELSGLISWHLASFQNTKRESVRVNDLIMQNDMSAISREKFEEYMENVLDRYSLYKPCTFPRCPNDIKLTSQKGRPPRFCSNDCRDNFNNRVRQMVIDIGKLSERVPRGASRDLRRRASALSRLVSWHLDAFQ